MADLNIKENLKPCPFCGGRAYTERAEKAKLGNRRMKVIYVRCSNCFARTGRMAYMDDEVDSRLKAKNDAIRAWNVRWGE